MEDLETTYRGAHGFQKYALEMITSLTNGFINTGYLHEANITT